MDRFASTTFKCFLREVAAATPRSYFNEKHVIQSSVGMIFRLSTDGVIKNVEDALSREIREIDLLFAQRAGYERDRNACILKLSR